MTELNREELTSHHSYAVRTFPNSLQSIGAWFPPDICWFPVSATLPPTLTDVSRRLNRLFNDAGNFWDNMSSLINEWMSGCRPPLDTSVLGAGFEPTVVVFELVTALQPNCQPVNPLQRLQRCKCFSVECFPISDRTLLTGRSSQASPVAPANSSVLMKMSVQYWWNDRQGKLKYWERNLSQCHFVQHKSHTD